MKTVLVTTQHFLRQKTERCISEIYRREYGASVSEFPHTLIAAFDGQDAPLCAAGLRFASSGFFSESYLEQPIEKTLTAWTGRSIERDRIFEVTTLASRNARASLPFLRHIIAFGETYGFDWAFFTATERLRALLRHMRLPLAVLAPAEPGRIECPERWGDYYLCGPRVCAVDGSRLGSARVAARLAEAHA
ncbi:MAG: thermostable hemolysin [Alphaproteobacteria bacterium]